MKKFRNPSTVHKPLAAYAHQVEVPANGRWLLLSGQVGMTLSNEIPEKASEQFELALLNIVENLKEAGMQVSDLTKLVFYMVEEVDGATRNEILKRILGQHEPCMTLIYIVKLASPALKVEIDAWAFSE